MDGVDPSWNRIPHGEAIGQAAREIIAKFDIKEPSASVPALLKLRSQLNDLHSKDPIVLAKKEQLDRILQECLGLKVETTVPASDVVPGEAMKLHTTATIHAQIHDDIPVRWVAVRYPLLKKEVKRGTDLQLNKATTFESIEKLPPATPLSQPYWLRTEGTPGMFHVDDPNLIGTAENRPPFPVEDVFEVGGQTIVIHDEPVQVVADSQGNQHLLHLKVIPPVSLRFVSDVVVMTPGASRSVQVEIKSARAGCSGTVQLEAPPDWKVSPAKESFSLANVGQSAQFNFSVTAPAKSETARITASAEMHGVRYHNQRQEINYAHIPRQLLQPPAVVKAVSVELATRGHTVGYLPGAGDSLPENLQEMGYAVKVLDDANLTAKDLEG
ncbi:MAG: hypothetical protein ACRD3W_16100, partial [Terriglobales bacterium]